LRTFTLGLTLLALTGCFRVSEGDLDLRMDLDGDGVSGLDDCDDSAADVGAATDWYADADGDGGGAGEAVTACTAPEGYVATNDDCDDADAAQHQGALWYVDDDLDGFGVGGEPFASCAPPEGYSAVDTDCDDARADVFPGAGEVCDGVDNDCDELVDAADTADLVAQDWYRDNDGDGFGAGAALQLQACELPGYGSSDADCDDEDASVSPAAEERCNSRDDDCDGFTDDEDDLVADPQPFFRDADGDGFGAGTAVLACLAPVDHVSQAEDCDDTTRVVNPAAAELCDGFDNDCDGFVDDADDDVVDTIPFFLDLDSDGFGDPLVTVGRCVAPSGYVDVAMDCDDHVTGVNPAATETCDGVDNDCDGGVDGALAVGAHTYYADGDGDGYGLSIPTVIDCAAPQGFAPAQGDCDDADVNTNPGAVEICDSLDNNCNGAVDEVDNQVTWYRDADVDGFGDDATTLVACAQPDGYVQKPGDCEDSNEQIRPTAVEICDSVDNNCNGDVDDADAGLVGTTFYSDGDGDSYGDPAKSRIACVAPTGYVVTALDCDDTNRAVNPGALEICNGGIDDNCDHLADDADSSVSDPATWYIDADRDTYGNPDVQQKRCVVPSGYVGNADDCDDRSTAGGADIHPGATEVCGGRDEDCDGLIDDADPGITGQPTLYADADHDLYGNQLVTTKSCGAVQGYVPNQTDCDDTSAITFPGAAELCDTKDNDCDGIVDEDVVTSDWYPDGDADGHGKKGVAPTKDCKQPVGKVLSSDDCDDARADVNPGQPELCSTLGVDDNCNLSIDENTAADVTTWYVDADHDLFGLSTNQRDACTQPSGYVLDATDCNDTNELINPNGTEVCNTKDDDCDGLIDDADGSVTGRPDWFKDADADTYGNALVKQKACVMPSTYVADSTDCNDSSATIHPGADERCSTVGVDDNCDGVADEATATDTTLFYRDADSDAYGNVADSVPACVKPNGRVLDATDCDDGAMTVYPGATEVCNGVDDDCNGVKDDGTTQQYWYPDVDADTYGDSSASPEYTCEQPSGKVVDHTDCNDNKSAVNPGVSEICDGVDNNCDGVTDKDAVDRVQYYRDYDGDTFGNPLSSKLMCPPPSTGYVVNKTDCKDTDKTVYPAAPELCDSKDNDCDTRVDEYCTLLDLGMGDSNWMIEGGKDKRQLAGFVAVGLPNLDRRAGVEVAVGAPGSDAIFGILSPGTQEAAFANLPALVSNAVDASGSALAWDDTWGLAVGSPAYKPPLFGARGSVYLVADPISATTLGTRYDPAATGDAGKSVAFYANGGKSIDTLLAGSPTTGVNAGVVYALALPATSRSTLTAFLTGEVSSGLGLAMARTPDLDRDGAPDLLVSASMKNNDGRVYVVRGGLSLTASSPVTSEAWVTYSADNAGDELGTSLGSADLNADGYPDLVLGAPGYNSGAGAVYVLFGTSHGVPLSGAVGSKAAFILFGSNAGDRLGTSLSVGQDVDADGRPDLIIGAPGWDQISPPVTNVGAAYVVTKWPTSSKQIDLWATARYGGFAAGDAAGYMVQQVGDMNADGRADWVVGAPMADGSGLLDAGELYIFYGAPY